MDKFQHLLLKYSAIYKRMQNAFKCYWVKIITLAFISDSNYFLSITLAKKWCKTKRSFKV